MANKQLHPNASAVVAATTTALKLINTRQNSKVSVLRKFNCMENRRDLFCPAKI